MSLFGGLPTAYLKGQGTYCSKLVISRVIIRVTPFGALITLLITYLLSPLPLQVDPKLDLLRNPIDPFKEPWV